MPSLSSLPCHDYFRPGSPATSAQHRGRSLQGKARRAGSKLDLNYIFGRFSPPPVSLASTLQKTIKINYGHQMRIITPDAQKQRQHCPQTFPLDEPDLALKLRP